MFEKKEFTRVDRDYFKVITETAYHLTIKSKNTLNDRAEMVHRSTQSTLRISDFRICKVCLLILL